MLPGTPSDLGSRRKERRNGPAAPSIGESGIVMWDSDILTGSPIQWVVARVSATISVTSLVLQLRFIAKHDSILPLGFAGGVDECGGMVWVAS